MDKYNKKTSFQKWISFINLDELSDNAKTTIENFDYYSKKFDFQTLLKVLLHAVYEELPSFREMDRAFMNQLSAKKSALIQFPTALFLGEQPR